MGWIKLIVESNTPTFIGGAKGGSIQDKNEWQKFAERHHRRQWERYKQCERDIAREQHRNPVNRRTISAWKREMQGIIRQTCDQDDIGVEVRPPSFIGAWRFWTRACYGASLPPQQVRELENELFGNTDCGQGAIRLRAGNYWPEDSIDTGERLDLLTEVVEDLTPLIYLGYGMLHYSGVLERPAWKSDTQFDLEVAVNARRFQKIGNQQQRLTPEQRKSDELENWRRLRHILWLWQTFGGIGARSRRGWGSMQIIGVSGQSCLAEIDGQYRNCLRSGSVAPELYQQLQRHFQEEGITLSENLSITPQASGLWRLCDHGNDTDYFIRSDEEGPLKVYDGLTAIPDLEERRYWLEWFTPPQVSDVGQLARHLADRLEQIFGTKYNIAAAPYILATPGADPRSQDSIDIEVGQADYSNFCSYCIVIPDRRYYSWDQALSLLGQKMIEVRSNLARDYAQNSNLLRVKDHNAVLAKLKDNRPLEQLPARAAFGLPHNYFFAGRGDGNFPDSKQDDSKSPRRASPVFLHVIKTTDDSYIPIVLWLKAPLVTTPIDFKGKWRGTSRREPNLSLADWSAVVEFLNALTK